MQKYKLIAEKRTVTGKKVKNLRKTGLIPGNIYGKNIASEAVQVNHKDFSKIFKEAGETGLVDLEVAGKIHPVLIHNIQLNPVTDALLHADFYEVNLKEKIISHVPVEFVGEAKAVSDKIGVLLTIMDEVEIEALPTDLPENIPLDVAVLKDIDQELKVKDLKIDATKLELKSDPELTIVKVGPLVSEEAAKEAAAEEAAKAAAATETAAAPAEGAVSAEGQKPETPKKEEAKKEEK